MCVTLTQTPEVRGGCVHNILRIYLHAKVLTLQLGYANKQTEAFR